MLNLNELLVFLTAAECGNFSEAGRQLHLSQPAISQKVDSLERQFGTKLFMRKGRSVCLTESGQALRPIARELIAEIAPGADIPIEYTGLRPGEKLHEVLVGEGERLLRRPHELISCYAAPLLSPRAVEALDGASNGEFRRRLQHLAEANGVVTPLRRRPPTPTVPVPTEVRRTS